MTPESARILGKALLLRERAAVTLRLGGGERPEIVTAEKLVTSAESYVHEQRIINRIVSAVTVDDRPSSRTRALAALDPVAIAEENIVLRRELERLRAMLVGLREIAAEGGNLDDGLWYRRFSALLVSAHESPTTPQGE